MRAFCLGVLASAALCVGVVYPIEAFMGAESKPKPLLPLGGAVFRDLLEHHTSGNVLFSPVSLEAALVPLYWGALGDTKAQLRKAIAAPKNQEPVCELPQSESGLDFRSANSLWLAQGLRYPAAFAAKIAPCSGVDALSLPAKDAEASINRWAAERTEGKITQLVERLGASVSLVVVNAVYFKAGWERPFDRAETRPGEFHNAADKTVKIRMMSQLGKFAYERADGVEIVRLPYGRGRYAMDLALPAAGGALDTAVAMLLALKRSPEISTGRVRLPRFQVTAGHELRAPLSRLGYGAWFQTAHADFSGLGLPRGTAALDEVKQRVFLSIDEAGTEAAAATTVSMFGSLPPPRAEFDVHFDRPFALAIRDTVSGEILFLAVLRSLPAE